MGTGPGAHRGQGNGAMQYLRRGVRGGRGRGGLEGLGQRACDVRSWSGQRAAGRPDVATRIAAQSAGADGAIRAGRPALGALLGARRDLGAAAQTARGTTGRLPGEFPARSGSEGLDRLLPKVYHLFNIK